jgi:hypothetical protein
LSGTTGEGKPREIRIPPGAAGWHGFGVPLPDIAWFHDAPKRRRYLAGVSGGADSVALLLKTKRRQPASRIASQVLTSPPTLLR